MEPNTATGKLVRGFSYISLLMYVAVLGVGLAATAVSWQMARQREKEAELLYVGATFREAIALYYNRSPGENREFPKQLRDLIKDPRYPDLRRYLRQIYRDPMTGDARWGTIAAPDGGIMGVYSLSPAKPIKRAGFVGPDGFDAAAAYSEWKFVYVPQALSAPAVDTVPNPPSGSPILAPSPQMSVLTQSPSN